MARAFSELVKYAQRQNLRVDDIAAKALLDVTSRVILKTPVDTGRARANWQPSLAAPASGKVNTQDKSGGSSLRSSAVLLNGRAAGYEYFLVNNLPYASVLEYGLYGTGEYATVKTTRDGYSVQAPEGMLRVSIREWNDAVLKALAAVR